MAKLKGEALFERLDKGKKDALATELRPESPPEPSQEQLLIEAFRHKVRADEAKAAGDAERTAYYTDLKEKFLKEAEKKEKD